MKFCRYSLTFLIISLLSFCSVFAVDDIFNKTGEIREDTVYNGVRFVIPDYYKLTKQSTVSRQFNVDDQNVGLYLMWSDASDYNNMQASSNNERLRKWAEQIVKAFAGNDNPTMQNYMDASLFGYESVSYYGEYSTGNLYSTLTYMPDRNSVLITAMVIDKSVTDSKYEMDYANMLKNAYVETPTQQVSNDPVSNDPPATNNSSDFDWQKYGDVWSDLGNAFENIDNDNIGGAFDALGDAYQKLGELSY